MNPSGNTKSNTYTSSKSEGRDRSGLSSSSGRHHRERHSTGSGTMDERGSSSNAMGRESGGSGAMERGSFEGGNPTTGTTPTGREKKLKKDKKPRKKRKLIATEDSEEVGGGGRNDDAMSDLNSPTGNVDEGGAKEGGEEQQQVQQHQRRREKGLKKGKKKKEKLGKEKGSRGGDGLGYGDGSTGKEKNSDAYGSRTSASPTGHTPSLPPKKLKKLKALQNDASQQHSSNHNAISGYSASQNAMNDMMRRALEEDQYSALGSVVDTVTSDSEADESNVIMTTGVGSASKATTPTRIDRNFLQSLLRKKLRMDGMRNAPSSQHLHQQQQQLNNTMIDSKQNVDNPADLNNDAQLFPPSKKKKKKKGKRGSSTTNSTTGNTPTATTPSKHTTTTDDIDHPTSDREPEPPTHDPEIDDHAQLNDEQDDASLFGQPNATTNSIWVECDKCKKWRRLRGVVDTKKLPSKWYCAMNKNDPERSKCTAPEEDYDLPSTPESAADTRARKHLRLWVRRLQCNEAYEARLPTMTRGKKRSSNKDSTQPSQPQQQTQPYEWVRCCNPSCGKWRAILKFMDAQTTVIDNAKHGEWYCVLNTWDEKTASCAAPQEALPAIGCPSWCAVDPTD